MKCSAAQLLLLEEWKAGANGSIAVVRRRACSARSSACECRRRRLSSCWLGAGERVQCISRLMMHTQERADRGVIIIISASCPSTRRRPWAPEAAAAAQTTTALWFVLITSTSSTTHPLYCLFSVSVWMFFDVALRCRAMPVWELGWHPFGDVGSSWLVLVSVLCNMAEREGGFVAPGLHLFVI